MKTTHAVIKVEKQKAIQFINTLKTVKETYEQKSKEFFNSEQYKLIKKILDYRETLVRKSNITQEDIAEFDKKFNII